MNIIFVVYRRIYDPIVVLEGVAVDFIGGYLLDVICLDKIINSV
jgi:hypothetical protein